MFQLKVGTFAQNKSLSTLLKENWLAKLAKAAIKPAIVVVMLCDVIQKEVKYAWHVHLCIK